MRSLRSLAFVAFVVPFTLASAVEVAIYADNGTNNNYVDGVLTGGGHTFTYYTDADIAAGNANGADVFFYARSYGSFGSTLSGGAGAQVLSTFSGNQVLLFADLTDMFYDSSYSGYANAVQLMLNSVSFAATGGKGFIGEFAGALWGLNNGVLGGTAGSLDYVGDYNPQNNVQPLHPVMSGLGSTFSYSDSVDYMGTSSGISAANILATHDQHGVMVAASAVPEPASLAVLGLGALAAIRRRRAK